MDDPIIARVAQVIVIKDQQLINNNKSKFGCKTQIKKARQAKQN